MKTSALRRWIRDTSVAATFDRMRLRWRIAGLKNSINEMCGPAYSPPNACCPWCFWGSRLSGALEEFKGLCRQAGLDPDRELGW